MGVITATIGVLVIITAAGVWTGVDLRVAGSFFRPGDGWFLAAKEPWLWLYRYGTIPGIVLSVGALIVWGMSFVRARFAPWRSISLLIVLTSVIGAGLLVNTVLKPYWGRPRPDQIVAFGGLWEYRHVHQPGTPGKGESFPCGHCTMGFVFVAVFFAYRRSPRLALAGGAAGIVLGGLLSAARIVQGAHFFLDTVWSLGIILLTAQVLYYLVLQIPAEEGNAARSAPLSPRRRRWMIAGIAVAVVLMGTAFATRRPFYRTFTDQFEVPPDGVVVVRLNAEPSRFTVNYEGTRKGQVRIDSRGFGWAGFDFAIIPAHRHTGNTTTLGYDIRVDSYFSELRHAVEVTLPATLKDAVSVRLAITGE
ncbi:MAG: phosphatase PAP2 family protein [Pseudomonadota bacterium]